MGLAVKVLRQLDWLAEQEQGRVPATHHLAVLAREAGFEAILAPSARLRGVANLVVFADRLRDGSVLQVVNEESPPEPMR